MRTKRFCPELTAESHSALLSERGLWGEAAELLRSCRALPLISLLSKYPEMSGGGGGGIDEGGGGSCVPSRAHL